MSALPPQQRRCPYCHAPAFPTARYCNQCGAMLPKKLARKAEKGSFHCGACGHENLPGELFCAQCGVQLPPVGGQPPPPPVPAPPEDFF